MLDLALKCIDHQTLQRHPLDSSQQAQLLMQLIREANTHWGHVIPLQRQFVQDRPTDQPVPARVARRVVADRSEVSAITEPDRRHTTGHPQRVILTGQAACNRGRR